MLPTPTAPRAGPPQEAAAEGVPGSGRPMAAATHGKRQGWAASRADDVGPPPARMWGNPGRRGRGGETRNGFTQAAAPMPGHRYWRDANHDGRRARTGES